MLDRVPAELYDVETKILKRAVRRNIDRFPKPKTRSGAGFIITVADERSHRGIPL